MFEQNDFFSQDDMEQDKFGKIGGSAGKWISFLAIFAILSFTAVHGISATLSYQAHGTLGKVTGVIGILSVEAIILSLILRWHNQAITGAKQRVAAIAGFIIGVLLVTTAVIVDSWMNSGKPLADWMSAYLGYVLPISPIIMAVISHIVDELEPRQLWSQQRAEAERQIEETQYQAYIASRAAELEAAKSIANANLNAKVSAAKQIAAHYQSEDVQGMIRNTALSNVPSLLRAIGVQTPDIVEGQSQEIVAFSAESTTPKPAIVETAADEPATDEAVNFTTPQSEA